MRYQTALHPDVCYSAVLLSPNDLYIIAKIFSFVNLDYSRLCLFFAYFTFVFSFLRFIFYFIHFFYKIINNIENKHQSAVTAKSVSCIYNFRKPRTDLIATAITVIKNTTTFFPIFLLAMSSTLNPFDTSVVMTAKKSIVP